MFDWFGSHLSDLFAIFGVLVTLGTAIVRLTPSVKDDAVMAKVVKFFNWVSVVNPKPPAKA